jgi:hypothetical protein
MGKMRWPNPALISSAISLTTSVSSSMAALSLPVYYYVYTLVGVSVYACTWMTQILHIHIHTSSHTHNTHTHLYTKYIYAPVEALEVLRAHLPLPVQHLLLLDLRLHHLLGSWVVSEGWG